MRTLRPVLSIGIVLITFAAAANTSGRVFADGFKGPENLAFDGKGGLYVTDTDHLWKVATNGKASVIYTRDPKSDGKSICGVCIGPEGRIFFSASNRILKLNPADNSIAEIAGGFGLANGITINDRGDLFIADMGGKTLSVVPAGAKQARALKTKVGMINGVKWDRAKNILYYTISAPGKLAGFRLNDKLEIVESITVAKFLFAALDDFTMDVNGNFYVCEWKGGKIVKVGADGVKSVLLEGIDGPSAVAFGVGDFSGKLFICVKGGSFKFNGTQLITAETDAKGYRMPFLQP